jgi:hypothetical protein
MGAFFKACAPAAKWKKLRRLGVSGASAFGAPSAWLFLVRLHACRAELRFARRMQFRPRWPCEQALMPALNVRDRLTRSRCLETCS